MFWVLAKSRGDVDGITAALVKVFENAPRPGPRDDGAAVAAPVPRAFAHFVGAALDKTQYAGMGGLLDPDAGTLALTTAASVLLAVLAGLVPALNLARRPVAELLREAG